MSAPPTATDVTGSRSFTDSGASSPSTTNVNTVRAQGPMRHLATDGAGREAFRLKPDVVLMERGQARFVLDAKWKRLDPDAANHGVSQDDAYQLFAYGTRYGCRRVILVYPRTPDFHQTLHFRFVSGRNLDMDCFPFNVADCAGSVGMMMRELLHGMTGGSTRWRRY